MPKSRKAKADGDGGMNAALELASIIGSMQERIDMLEAFVEDVLLSVADPDRGRLVIEGKYEGHIADVAFDLLGKRMVEYRRMKAALKARGVDMNELDDDGKVVHAMKKNMS